MFEVLEAHGKRQNNKTHQVLYNRQEDQLYRKTFDNDSCCNNPFEHPVSITAHNELVYLTSAGNIKKNKDKLDDVIVNDEVMNELDQNDNLVVLFCEINTE